MIAHIFVALAYYCSVHTDTVCRRLALLNVAGMWMWEYYNHPMKGRRFRWIYTCYGFEVAWMDGWWWVLERGSTDEWVKVSPRWKDALRYCKQHLAARAA